MTPRVVVVGLGPAGADLVTAGTLAEIERHDTRFVRTTRHPAAGIVAGARSFDDLYDAADSIDEVYDGIVEALVGAAMASGPVLYAVPGSPLVAERTVELLLERDDVAVDVRPALSFLDLAWARLGVDPIALGVRVVDGHRFATEAAGERGPLLVAQCDRPSVLSDIKLAVETPPDGPVTVVSRLGAPDEEIREVTWVDLDRDVEPDHLTSLWIPRMGAPVAGEVAAFEQLVERLRDECPWDREQTHRTLTTYLLEETYEVVDVLDRLPDHAGAIEGELEPSEQLDDAYAALEEELGDLLFQIVFHARLAAEAGRFDLSDVARGIREKLTARHPHVFGDADVGGDPREVERVWAEIKASTSERESVFDGIPTSLPALRYVAELLARADRAGVATAAALEDATTADAASSDVVAIVGLLVAAVASAHAAGIDADDALRRCGRTLERRLRAAETPAGS